MLQDLDACRSTEIEELTGAVIRLGEKHGVPTPVNEVLYRLVKEAEKKAEGSPGIPAEELQRVIGLHGASWMSCC